MRVDVDLDHRDIEAELAALRERLQQRGDVLQTLPIFAARAPELVFKYREVDGEFHVYAEDPVRDVLAGCTVFNRVRELDARVGCFVRSPHSRYASAYRRKGIATAVYQWALGAGMGLVSGPRQSVGAYGLWGKLARSHAVTFVRVEAGRLRVMDQGTAPVVVEELETRMLLLGPGHAIGLVGARAPSPLSSIGGSMLDSVRMAHRTASARHGANARPHETSTPV